MVSGQTEEQRDKLVTKWQDGDKGDMGALHGLKQIVEWNNRECWQDQHGR